jgi:hypothetical protein
MYKTIFYMLFCMGVKFCSIALRKQRILRVFGAECRGESLDSRGTNRRAERESIMRYMICITEYYQLDKSKDGSACRTHGRDERCTYSKFWTKEISLEAYM